MARGLALPAGSASLFADRSSGGARQVARPGGVFMGLIKERQSDIRPTFLGQTEITVSPTLLAFVACAGWPGAL